MTLRGVLRLGAIVLLLLACLPWFLTARLFGRHAFWIRAFIHGVGRILGLRVAVEGRRVEGHVLYAANHSSWLDILAIGGVSAARFVAKADIGRWPLIGALTRMGGAVFVERERRGTTRDQADAVARALEGARPVVLFAEGATGDGVTLQPFRPPLFVAAVEVGVAVQPLTIDFGARRREIAWPDGTGFAIEMKRILNRRGTIPVTLRFAPPLDARALGRKALAAAAHDAVAAGLAR